MITDLLVFRGLSSVGRAAALQATGQGFESPRLHILRDTDAGHTNQRYILRPSASSVPLPAPLAERLRHHSSKVNTRVQVPHGAPFFRVA